LTDTAGTITDTYFYTAFGEELAKTGTTENEFRYVGEQWDPNAGFYYLRARWYDQSTGRFASVDPYAGFGLNPISLHRYLYAYNSPISFSDPSGLYTIADVEASTTIRGILTIIRSNVTKEVRGAAFKKLGKLAENKVKHIIEEVLEEVIQEAILNSVGGIADIGYSEKTEDLIRYDGKKKRVIDFMATAGECVADIEVKYGVPKIGSEAMERLVSQVSSMKRGSRSVKILVLVSDNVKDAQMRTLKSALKQKKAGPVQIIQGMDDLAEFLREFYRKVF
jgi:RHS repeat-associated protein